MIRISVIPGDGIGPEVTREAVLTLRALALDLSVHTLDHVNADTWLRTGTALSDEDFEEIRRSDAVLFGAIGDPRVTNTDYARSVLLRLRFGLDLYVNLRPATLLHPRLSPLREGSPRAIDCVIVRENTEGLYAGIGGRLRPDTDEEIATDTEVNTYHGVSRILRYAFGIARRGVCMVDKSNAVRFGGQLWQRCWAEARREHPDVPTAHRYVDTAAMELVSAPEQFDVIVTNNSYGDILSDVAAQVAGGLGTAASGNINPERRIGLFEPVHGTAPDIVGLGIANPFGAILSAALMVEFLGLRDAAAAIRAAVSSAIADGACTPDLGGELSTVQAGEAVRRRLGGTEVALSRTQRQLWFAEQLSGHPSGYLVPMLLRLDGPLDVDALEDALTTVVARHDALRTGVRETADGPVGLVRPARPVRLRVESYPERLVAEPIDLRTDPPIRCRLFRRADDSHVLWVNVHHLAFDDWSRHVFYGELEALLQGRQLPAVPRYRDVAEAIEARTDEAGLAAELDYWRQKLADVNPFELAPERPRPSRRAGVGRVATRTVPGEVTRQLEEFARACGVTLASVLFAASLVVLRCYSGRDDVTVGTTVALRDEPGAADVIGPLFTTVVLRCETAAAKTFDALVDATADVILEALEHADVPFDLVVEELAPARDLARTPLFQVQLGYGSQPRRAPEVAGLTVCELPVPWETSKYDVVIWFDHVEDGTVALEVAWDASLYHDQTLQRFTEYLGAVVEHVAAAPLSGLDDIAIPDADAALILAHGAGPVVDFPDLCLHEAFEAQVRRTPDATAVVAADGSTVTFAELNAMANQLAHRLIASGARPETFVAIRVGQSVAMFVGLLGILKSGAAYVPLDASQPLDRIRFVLADTAAGILVTDSAPPDGFDGEVIRLDAPADGADLPTADPVSGTNPENLVYVMYTSGSTGRPKGVLISHRGLMNYLWWGEDGYGLGGERGAPMVGSIAYDLSVPNFFLPLIKGKSVTLLRDVGDEDSADGGGAADLAALAELLTGQHDFSLLKITPGHVDVLRDLLPAGSVDSIRTTVIGADEVRPDTVTGWRAIAPGTRIINEYGPTETVVGCSIYPVPEDVDSATLVSIGKPIANMHMYVLDADLRQMPWGAVGELYIGGVSVARGYLKRPGLTAERFLPDPHSPYPGARLYRSGDLARLRPDGNVEFLGRVDHQVKIRGYRVELGEVEVALRSCPGVADAVVMAWLAAPGDRRLVAYLARQSLADVSAAGVRAFLSERLPAHAVPSRVVILDALPRLANGKVDRKALPSPQEFPDHTEVEPVAPRSDLEKFLLEIWIGVLEAPGLGIHDDFFDHGGHSLLVMRAANRMRELTEVDIPFSLIFECRTVATVAAWIESGGAHA